MPIADFQLPIGGNAADSSELDNPVSIGNRQQAMQLGTVIGHATSTIKHPSFTGWRLLVVQPLGASGQPEADPVVAIDKFNAGVG